MNPQLRGGSVLMLVLGAAGCRSPAVERDAFTVEAERVRSITTTGGRVDAVDEVVREPLRVSQAWRLVLETDWATFATEAARSLAATYRCTPEADRLSCARSIPGDHFSLSFTRTEMGRVQARLEARPD
jgi:hypothetical protein